MIISLSQALAATDDFQKISVFKNVRLDLRYATTNNFMHENVYGDFREAYLHKIAFAKIKKASELLAKRYPDLSFVIFDALRPRSVQRKLWAHVVGTDQEMYVANPDKGSVHNYGFALDLGLADARGRELDMGAGFDDFTELSQPKLEEKLLAEKKITAKQIENRKILRSIMTEAGFIQLDFEWWHFDALPGQEVRSKYQIVENL